MTLDLDKLERIATQLGCVRLSERQALELIRLARLAQEWNDLDRKYVQDRMAHAMMKVELEKVFHGKLEDALMIDSEVERTYKRLLDSGEAQKLLYEMQHRGLQIVTAVASTLAEKEKTMNGAALISAERERQVVEEGWSPEHDDEHIMGTLAAAAACYALTCMDADIANKDEMNSVLQEWWPWDKEWWKPSADPIRNLTKAGALIAAEIDRIQRLKEKEKL